MLSRMRRVVLAALGLYVLFAIIGRFVEGMGAVQCGCSPSCWCKRPVLSTFRWVFPFKHRFDGDETHPTPTPFG
jgi:hypothetical protein